MVYAGTTGNISGSVHDSETGDPLEGATVSLLGTSVGSFCDAEGNFQLYNVPAGEYTLMISLIGYQQLQIENFHVVPDFTKQVNVELKPQSIAMGEVVVSGERALIQRDETATVRVTTSEEMQNMALRTATDVVGLQAGVVRDAGGAFKTLRGSETAENESGSSGLYIRGGRGNEVAFIVDGVNQQDPISGATTTAINNNAIEQVVLTTGGFNAEYGRIMSGVVNVTTKGGGKEYHGSAEMLTDAVAPGFGADTYEQNVYSLSLGGPLVPGNENFRFFVSGEIRDMGDREPRNAVIEPFEVRTVNGEKVKFTNDGRLPHNSLEGYSLQGKLNLDISPVMDLELSALGSENDFEQYIHAYKYNMKHAPEVNEDNLSLAARFRHTLDPKTFYTLSANYFSTERFRGDGVHGQNLRDYGRLSNPGYNDNYDLFLNGDIDTTEISRDEFGNVSGDEGHVFADYVKRESSYIGFKADMVTQRINNNEIKFGVEYQRHTLRRYHDLYPEQTAVIGYDENGEVQWRRSYYNPDNPTTFQDVNSYGIELNPDKLKQGIIEFQDVDDGPNGAKHPITMSAYLQNKLEYEGIVVNFGLRYDYLDAATDALRNEERPFAFGDSTKFDDADLTDSKAYHKLSPRLGISFPITERMMFRFSYGKFFQQPNLENLYVNYDFLSYKLEQGGYYFPIGNPNLKPEETTAYEIGLTRQIGENLRFDVTAYYKDISGLVQVKNQPAKPRSFASYRNSDFGSVKGFDFALKMRRINHIALDLAYTLSQANGTGSNTQSQRNNAWTGEEPAKSVSPLDFDQRHDIKATVDVRFGEDEGPVWGGIQPFENFGANFIFTAASGTPYTPVIVHNEVTLASVSTVPDGPINSRRKPWSFNVDAKFTRDFPMPMGDFQVYLWIENLFDARNVVRVYESSGDGETTTFLSTENGEQFATRGPDAVEVYQDKERNPNNFSKPRMVRLGLVYQF